MYLSSNKKLVVLGGGSAGWLTALYLQKLAPDNEVILIEDPNTPPIIAGESGSISLNNLMRFLDIDFDSWIRHSNAIPKLGGKFVNWTGDESHFYHGITHGFVQRGYTAFHPEFADTNDFLAGVIAEKLPFSELFLAAKLMATDQLSVIKEKDLRILTPPMWHFDSRGSADFFKKVGLSRKISFVEGKYTHSDLDESGNIISLNLEGERSIQGDWFFDCSGFARLLTEKTLNAKFQDYSIFFPACAVVAWWDKPELRTCTKMTAMNYGWNWNINLAHRSGNGYVYDPNFITVDQAVAEAESRYQIKIDPVAQVKFKPSMTTEMWKNNVISIGLSSGFLEPLESNGLALVAYQLAALAKFWNPSSKTNSHENLLFNKDMNTAVGDVADFLNLHYLGGRSDNEYWLQYKDQARVRENNKSLIECWQEGFLGEIDTRVYELINYLIVGNGLKLLPTEKIKSRLLGKRKTILEDIRTHYNLIQVEVDNNLKQCYHIKDWKQDFYGTTSSKN